jgi:hypothetical protein
MDSIIGSRAFVERRRSWRERLFTLPWRPLVAWVPQEPVGYVRDVRLTDDGVSLEFTVSRATPGDEQG